MPLQSNKYNLISLCGKNWSRWLLQALCDVWVRSEELSYMDLHLFMKFKTVVIEQDITLNHSVYMILNKLQFYRLPEGVILFTPRKGKVQVLNSIVDN